MRNKLERAYYSFIADDRRASRILFLLIALAFTWFAIFAKNTPLLGPVPHRLLNVLPAITAFLSFLLVTLTPWGYKNWQSLVTVFLYEFNIINIYLLYATQLLDMYAYQFIIGVVISSYFFQNRKQIRHFFMALNTGVLFTLFTSHAQSSAPADFYVTYLVSQVVFAVLYRYRFITEDKLVESERRYRLLAENSFDLICIHAVDARLEFVSPSIKRLMGYEPDDLTGKYPAWFMHPDDASQLGNFDFRDERRSFLDKPMQFRLKSKTGQYHWFETVFTLLSDSDGTTGVVLSQSRNIDNRRLYAEQLEDRTRELERSNADLETFAFVSSHDMQEPLRMISNYTQLLKKRYSDKLDSDAKEYIEYANRGAIQLSQLIRDLLAYSRIGRADVVRSRVNMARLLDEMKKNIELEVSEKQALIEYNELHEAYADKNMLMLVVQNLVLNGIKYNSSVRPVVKITSELAEHNRQVVYCVEDNGIGIDEAHQQKIFEPFQRLHTKAEYPGTGLGLSICKKIIERGGGRIWVKSSLGNGAGFYFSLPAAN
ncbi:MAG TPA: ATP-binding protein [Chitinophagales bacterium]|nr:ATP-binding protein [Chitinophagales bacterium]